MAYTLTTGTYYNTLCHQLQDRSKSSSCIENEVRLFDDRVIYEITPC